MENNLFNILLILTIVVVSIIIYISAKSQSKEEYVEVYLTSYNKEINTKNLSFDFSVKSYYIEEKKFKINLYLNETFQKSRIITIDSWEKLDLKENVELPTKGTYKVKISVITLDDEKEAYVYFWVEVKTQAL